jgi:hypothetical protein
VESCNGADDDCDTVPDDGLACVLGATSACTNACGAPGARTCGAGCAWSACCGAAEVCRTDCSRPACDDDCDGTTDEGCPPCNDACSAAVDISAGGDFPGTTVGAADDSVRCVAACGTGGRDVWYRFTLAAEEVVFLSLQGAVWDTVLDVRRGTSCGALAAQVCQDDACGGRQALWTGVLPAGTYYVVVDGCYEADSGPFTLRFRRSACPGAVRVSAPGTVSGTTCGAGNEHYAGTVCGGYNSPDVSHYVAMCPGSRTLSASTCDDGRGWRNNLEVRSGSGGVCGAAQVACQPPNCAWSSYTPYRSSLSASVAGNDLYFVVVDGYGPETCGQYALQLSW